jgi:hypothetical protein
MPGSAWATGLLSTATTKVTAMVPTTAINLRMLSLLARGISDNTSVDHGGRRDIGQLLIMTDAGL